jgi:hypothetical protein
MMNVAMMHVSMQLCKSKSRMMKQCMAGRFDNHSCCLPDRHRLCRIRFETAIYSQHMWNSSTTCFQTVPHGQNKETSEAQPRACWSPEIGLVAYLMSAVTARIHGGLSCFGGDVTPSWNTKLKWR